MTVISLDRIWYSDRTAAEALSCSRTKIRELMDLGEIDSFRIGGMRRITREALEAYARRAEQEARRSA